MLSYSDLGVYLLMVESKSPYYVKDIVMQLSVSRDLCLQDFVLQVGYVYMGVGGLAHLHKVSYCFMSYHPVNHEVNGCQITCTFWLLILSFLVSKLSFFFTRTGVIYLLYSLSQTFRTFK